MTKMAKAQNIILSLLKDGNIHTVDEIRKEIEKDPDLCSTDSNFVHVVLNNLKSKKGKIRSAGIGLYQTVDDTVPAEITTKASSYRASILKAWSTFYNQNIDSFELSLDMSEEDFHNAKWLYELNKRIEKLIKTFD